MALIVEIDVVKKDLDLAVPFVEAEGLDEDLVEMQEQLVQVEVLL